MTKQLATKDYMQDGWDSGPIGCHPYNRGCRNNKIGMTIMWAFYGIVTIQILHVVTVIPFFPITFMMLLGLAYIFYVAWRAS